LNITVATDMVNVNLKAFNKLDKETRETLVRLGKEMEAAMWAKVAEIDKEKEAICNQNGIETVPPSKELLKALADVTENIRADWLKDAPADAKAAYADFMKKVGR
jgi:TRAP-type C4-dicarboxylate transport system substrate-binding protein